MRQDALFFTRGEKVYGRFYDLILPSGQHKKLSLCSVRERDKYSTKGDPSQRTRFLTRLYEETLEREIQKKPSGAGADSVQKIIQDFIERKHPVDKVRRQLEFWSKELPRIKAQDLKPHDIVQVKEKLMQQVSNSTVNRYISALSKVYTVCVEEWFVLENNPVRRIPKLEEPKGRTRSLTNEERHSLLSECRRSSNPDLYLVVMFAISTGGREMEIWGLKWSDVDLVKGSVIFRDTKNGDTRRVAFDGPALTEFRNKIRRIDTDLVFPGRRDKHKPISFRKPFETAVGAADLKDFRFHDLRHTFASYMAMDGATLRDIADALGHRTLNMVLRYSHLTEEHSASVVRGMNQRMLA